MTGLSAPHEHAGVILVDHTTQPGGAELALPRIARHSHLTWQFAFLEPLTDTLPFDQDALVLAPDSRRGLLGQMLFLKKLLREHPRDVIASNTLRAAVLVAVLKSRRQVHVQLLRDGVSPDSLSHVKRLASDFVFARVTKILPNSLWTGLSVPSRFRDLVSAPVFSPSGTPAAVVAEPASDVQGTPLRLLSLSRVVDWKGIHIVLEALAVLASEVPSSRVELTIAGDALMGDEGYVERLQSAAAALPFDVVFLPHQLDVGPLLDRHDVLIHASTRPEPFGQVIVQGLSHGLAVLASRGGGPDELIRHGDTGLLHEPGDPASLAASISLLLTEPATRARIGAAGARAAETFSDATCVALLDEELIRVMMSNRR
jgi:glycosyltransferase involved in cell wall biosynthesis